MATKAELERALADRDRERPTVNTVAALPVMVCGALLTVAVLYLAAQKLVPPDRLFPPAVLAVPGVVGWLVAHVEAKAYFTPRMYGPGLQDYARVVAALAGGASTAWLVWTGTVGPEATWFYLPMGGACLALLWWALLWAADRRLRDPAPAATPVEVDPGMPWAQIVERTTGGQATLKRVDPHRAGVKLTVEPGETVDDNGQLIDEDMTFDDFARTASAFASLASKEFRRRNGTSMPLNCARPEEGSDDAQFVMHVTMRDVFKEHTVFAPSSGPQDITKPVDLGEYEDATRIEVSLLSGHARVVGATGSGKSVEINGWLARVTECTNALAWVCATDKLIPLIFPWLRSWFAGQAPQPTLDYVAGLHIDNVLGMLADAYQLCCERNARLTDESKHTPTPEEPAVFVFLEEMSHTMEFGDTIKTHDGMECDATTLLSLIARAGRSAAVRLVLISQTALNSSGGDSYPEIIRNCQIRVCLRTMESHDGYRTIPALNNVDTTQIPLYTKIVQPSIEKTRAMPGKAPELDGTKMIDPVAVRNASWRPAGGVEADSNLGERYATRWDPQRHPELARAVAKHGLQWRIPTALAGTAGQGGDTTPAPTPTAAPTPPWNIITGGTDRPGGGSTMHTWTDTDDAAVAQLLGNPAGGDEPDVQRAGGFRLPNGDKELQALRDLARDIAENPWNPDQVGEEPNPLPEPLAAIINWLDEQEADGRHVGFYLSDTIAAGIGHPDTIRMGREIWRAAKIRSRQATAAEDGARKRKGYDVAALREAAQRIRFGL